MKLENVKWNILVLMEVSPYTHCSWSASVSSYFKTVKLYVH